MIDYFVTQFIQRGAGTLATDLNAVAGGFGRVESAATKSGRIGGAMVAAGAVGLTAMTNLAKGALQAAGEVSRVEVGYRTVLRNEKKVRELSKGVREFDVKSPFSYLDSARASQMLLASGFRDDLLPTMYAIGNATVAAGKGTDTFIRALAIMGKIKTQGVLSGVRVNQFAAAGINVKDILKRKLKLSDDEMMNIGKLKLKADVVIPALIEGLNEQFKGGLEKAANQYLGALETLEGSQDKLKASIGKSIEKDAIKGVKALTRLIDATSKWTSAHPRLTKMALAFGFLGSAALMFLGLRKAMAATRLITDALVASTQRDIVTERIKTGVAGKETLARNGAALAASRQVAATGALAKMAPGAAPKGFPSVGPIGAVVAGAAAGYSIYDTYSNKKNQAAVRATTGLNVTENGARGAGLFAGAGLAALTFVAPQFVLPALATIAIAKAIEAGFNKVVNEPAEKKAEQGSGAENTEVMGKDMPSKLKAAQERGKKKDRAGYQALQDVYNEMSVKAGLAGDKEAQDANAAQARSYGKLKNKAGKPGTVEYDVAQYRAGLEMQQASQHNLPDMEGMIARFEEQRRSGVSGQVYGKGWSDPALEQEQAENERLYGSKSTPQARRAVAQAERRRAEDGGAQFPSARATVGAETPGGTNTIKIEVAIPARYSDDQARRLRSETMTPGGA